MKRIGVPYMVARERVMDKAKKGKRMSIEIIGVIALCSLLVILFLFLHLKERETCKTFLSS